MKKYAFDWNFTKICSYKSNKQYSKIGSDNGMAPIRRQAIIWTNNGLFTDEYMRHSASTSSESHINIYSYISLVPMS